MPESNILSIHNKKMNEKFVFDFRILVLPINSITFVPEINWVNNGNKYNENTNNKGN